MIPAEFEYLRPRSLSEAVSMLNQHVDDAKVLAGGHSLIPAMKLRLAQPGVVVDIGRIADLNYIRVSDGKIAIGALTTHAEIGASDLLRDSCPMLTEVAPLIGDVQVRNKGTIGGSLAHADPAADWPAAILALEAELEIAGPNGHRTVKAADFFVDMLQTDLKPNEILCEIRVPQTSVSVAYVKFAQKASGFAVCGVAAAVNRKDKTVRVGVTGIAPRPYRAARVEAALRGAELDARTIAAASAHAATGVSPLSDIHASAEFRANLAQVYVRRALTRAAGK